MSSLCACHFVGFVMLLLTYWMKFLVYDLFSSLYPRHLCRGLYSFRLFVRPFICSLVCTSVPFVELLQSFTCNQQNDLCAQRRLCTQWVAKSERFFMRTAKTDQTGQMPRLICDSFCAEVILFVLSCGCSHIE